jgi:hypothetical protein
MYACICTVLISCRIIHAILSAFQVTFEVSNNFPPGVEHSVKFINEPDQS